MIQDLIQLFNAFSNKINSKEVFERFKEDETLIRFKKYMKKDRKIILLLQSTIPLFVIIRFLIIFKDPLYNILLDCCSLNSILELMIILFKETTVSTFIFILSVVLWYIYAFINFFKINKYIKLVNEFSEVKGDINWDEWQYKDIILDTPIDLRKKEIKSKSITFTPKGKYVLYLLCRNNNSGIKWVGVTNVNDPSLLKNDDGECIFHQDEDKLTKDGQVKLRVNNHILNQKKGKKDFKPVQIIAIRIRSNIFNEKMTLKNFDLM